jgi:Arc/MetJ-type ribon-helix-helix transcriptional regulator
MKRKGVHFSIRVEQDLDQLMQSAMEAGKFSDRSDFARFSIRNTALQINGKKRRGK